MFAQKHLQFGFIAVFCIQALTTPGAAPPVSSPEGTLTAYVQGKNSLIYPPRSARAQKVEFDTAERQMIYEPDTPFRAFFNSHAADFAPGKLDYAKTTILADVIASLRNKQYIRFLVKEIIDLDPDGLNLAPLTAAASKEDKKARRDRVANLLIDGITLILERENYPNLRDDDINRLLEKVFKGEGPDVDELGSQTHKAWVSFVLPDHRDQILWELRQALLEKRCLKSIINDSVARRPELFRGVGSPAGAMKDAQEQIEKFIEENLAILSVAEVAAGKKSLWELFLASLSEHTSPNVLFVLPGTETKLSDDDFSRFAKSWREELVAMIDKNLGLDKAAKDTLASRRTNLFSTANAADATKLAAALASRPSIPTTFGQISRLVPLVRGTFDSWTNAQAQSRTAANALSLNRATVAGALTKLEAKLTEIESGRVSLTDGFQSLAVQRNGFTLPDLIAEILNKAPGAGGGTNSFLALATEAKSALDQFDTLRDQFRSEDTTTLQQVGAAAGAYKSAADVDKQKNAAADLRILVKKFTKFPEADIKAPEITLKKLEDLARALSNLTADDSAKPDVVLELKAHGASLRANWITSDIIRKALQQRSDGISSRDGAIDAVAALDTSFQGFETAATTSKANAESEAVAKKEFDTRLTELANAQNDFLKSFEAELTSLRGTLPSSLDFSTLLAEAKSRIDASLALARQGATNAAPSLDQTLTGALKDLATDTSKTEQTILTRIITVFGTQPSLIKSDDPVLKAFLKSGKITFANDDFTKKAISDIPAKFTSNATGANTIEALLAATQKTVSDPEITYLFGNGLANAKVMDAFKAEFFNAFKHRLPEALAAEREADYDYWWLSFYPKAVPVGANQFHGQSILEIGFNENIVPVEQYHRWLQDQNLAADRSETEFAHRTSLAVSVLNDFLAALDSSLLSDRFSGLREDIQEAIEVFTRRGNQRNPNENAYREGMTLLIRKAVEHDITDRTGVQVSSLFKDTSEKGYREKSSDYLSGLVTIIRGLRSISSPIDDSRPPSTDKDSLEINIDEVNRIKNDDFKTDPSLAYFEEALSLFKNSEAIRQSLQTNVLAQLEDGARAGLAWRDLDIRHIAFAAVTASIRNTALPEKVQLYCSAFWGGSRRFTTEANQFDTNMLSRVIKDADVRSSVNNIDRFLVPFENTQEVVEMAKYLLLRGVSYGGLSRLLEKYKKFTGDRLTLGRLPSHLENAAISNQSFEGRLFTTNLSIPWTTNLTITNLPTTNLSISGSVDARVAARITLKTNIANGVANVVPIMSFYADTETGKEERSWSLCAIVKTNVQRDLRRLTNQVLRSIANETSALQANYSSLMEKLKQETNRIDAEFKAQAAAHAARALEIERKWLDQKYQSIKGKDAGLTNLLQQEAWEKRVFEISVISTNQETDRRELTNRISDALAAYAKSADKLFETYHAATNALGSQLNALSEKLPCLDDQCAHMEAALEALSRLENDVQCEISRWFFAGVTYAADAKPSKFLGYPSLWPLEMKLDRAKERFRSIIVHLYHSNYPGIPDVDRIKSDFLQRDSAFKYIIYEWLRELYVHLVDENLLASYNPNPDAGKELLRRQRVRVLGTLLLDRHPYLTPDVRRELLEIFSSDRSIYDWLDKITSNQAMVDQLHGHLLETTYKPVFTALAYLNKVERQAIPFMQITSRDYESFRYYSKPRQQKNIQIVELLPVSRDDLVSMAVNEGGVVAKIAGQVEGAAAYDMNQMQTILRNAQLLQNGFKDNLTGNDSGPTSVTNDVIDLSANRSASQAKSFSDLSKLGQGADLSGYSLGATAQGSIYGRAKSALAYSRRREYLDAVITSAGVGDNFAKWVIRPSDLRSELAQKGGRKLVAAKHSGFPNGDQPFYMLVKVPRSAIHTDWGGRRYIYFNSAYSATGRHSFWRDFGWPGLLVKAPFTIINHNMWRKMEETMVTAVFPFMWNIPNPDFSQNSGSRAPRVKALPNAWFDSNEREMIKLGRTPNALGGEILLDDTDKIRYSEIRTLLDAEADFVQLTRTAQISDLNSAMDNVQKEAGTFRTNVVNNLQQRINSLNSLQQTQVENAKLKERQDALDERLKKLQDDVKALAQPAPANQ